MKVLEELQWEHMQEVVDDLPKADSYCSDRFLSTLTWIGHKEARISSPRPRSRRTR